MSVLPGIGGSLFPSRYLAIGLEGDLAVPPPDHDAHDRRRRRCLEWWRRLEQSCGPATGLRAIFDLAAMPLAGMLGFRCRGVRFDRDRVTAVLDTPRGIPVGLLVLPWATRPPARWRDVTGAAREIGAAWCLVIAPPFVSVVDARGCAVRRSVDFRFPDALDSRSFARFWTLTRAAIFEPGAVRSSPGLAPLPALDALVARARRFQDRVRDDLQQGVLQALTAFGDVLPAAGDRRPPPLDEALTIVYRILFLLFAEAHDLVPTGHPIFRNAYAVSTLCREAVTGGATTRGVWEGLAAVTRLSRTGCRHEDLIVRPFNGQLFARRSAPSLERGPRRRAARRAARARDAAMARALVALATRPGRGGREEISYADLGVEQLGAVYERVLDLSPHASRSAQGRPRKESGTFYTPRPLAEFVVRRTLAPLVTAVPADRILSLRVVDPAMGSGAFLVAACRYLASAYEHALVEEGRLSEADLTEDVRAGFRRLVAERCLAGVDVNPMAVQLARLSLWLTSLAGGKPLTFLDHRLRRGNSLVGASPDDLWKRPRSPGAATSLPLFATAGLEASLRDVVRPLGALAAEPDDTVDVVKRKEAVWSRLTGPRSPLEPWRLACHLWCARWFWPDAGPHDVPAPTWRELGAALDRLLRHDRTLAPQRFDAWIAAARVAAADIGFFHWPLEFADVFYQPDGTPRPEAGFDAVIGNPPWEMLRADPGAGGRPHGGGASDARADLVRFLRESSLYPDCDRGHVNLYQPFLERASTLARPGGRLGLILPWGLATDDGAAALRRRVFERMTPDTLVGLDNGAGLFPIHRSLRFLVLVAARPRAEPRRPGLAEVRVRCGVRTPAEIDTLPDVDGAGDASAFPVRLTRETLCALGGSSYRIPDVRRPGDLAWLTRLARAHPTLGAAGDWAVSFGRELNASDDRPYFGHEGLPVLEGKCIAPFQVHVGAASRRISEDAAGRLLPDRRFARPRLAYRDVSGPSNERSLIAAVVPAGAVTTHTLFCLRTCLSLVQQHFLCGLFNSFVLNAIVRLLMGGHVTTTLVEALPVPPWRATPLERRIARLAARASRGPVRPALAARLQAGVARLYGLDARTFAEILDGFPRVAPGDRQRALGALRRGRRPML